MANSAGESSPFVAVLAGERPGEILARDDERRFALVKSLHPEGVIHTVAHAKLHILSVE